MSVVIVGAGPNLGLAVAKRFGREGFAVGLISRTESRLVELRGQLRLEGITTAGAATDIRDSEALASAIHQLAAELGPVEVLEYSPLPAPEFMKPVLETTVERSARIQRARRRGRDPGGHWADARSRPGDDPLHHGRRRRQPQPGPGRRGNLIRGRGRLRPDAS